jgi:RimJ/RimL family protein N-acetyltransferase
MNRAYRCLQQQTYRLGEYSIVPLRDEDKYLIMNWRNEQIYHLRQQQLLVKEDQEKYFSTVVAGLFEQEQPNQVLFSYLENGICIGYGGLVHINWKDRYAEVSFIIDPRLEKGHFKKHWVTFLSMIEKVAFEGMEMHKIFTYAFDLRPHLYEAVEAAGFTQEARLKAHCLFDGKYIDVVIHSKINQK